MGKPTAKQMKGRRAKAVGKAPVWLKTAAISKQDGPGPIKGKFGAASPATRIDPAVHIERLNLQYGPTTSAPGSRLKGASPKGKK
jgi:hypothetical protein